MVGSAVINIRRGLGALTPACSAGQLDTCSSFLGIPLPLGLRLCHPFLIPNAFCRNSRRSYRKFRLPRFLTPTLGRSSNTWPVRSHRVIGRERCLSLTTSVPVQ